MRCLVKYSCALLTEVKPHPQQVEVGTLTKHTPKQIEVGTLTEVKSHPQQVKA